MDQYHQEIKKWRRLLGTNLRKENSWLALAGLFWLCEGKNSFGTDPSNGVVFPAGSGPGQIGDFILQEGQVTLRVRDGLEVRVDGEIKKEAVLKPDSSVSPTEITLENLTFILIEREDGLGIRLWDNQRPERENFPGRSWFPIQESYIIRGIYEPYDKDLDLLMSRKNGSDYQTQAEGQIRFSLDKREFCLVAFEQEDGSLFTLFLDQTSGKESYPAGRYLVIDPPQGEMVEIDFNRVFNPPCAFTDFATCPLPPSRNRLDVAVLAGERAVG